MFAQVNGVRLFFDMLNPTLEIRGAGLKEKPALVCLPGGPGGDHQTLRPWFDRFADIAQVIYLDPRGGGRSDHGDAAAWTLDQWGDDIAAFCDVVGLEKPVVLGSSGGSLMVQSFLARHAGRAGGAILINACSRMVEDEIVAAYEKLGGADAGAAARAMYGSPGPQDYAAFFQRCLPLYSTKRDLFVLTDGRERVRMNPAPSQRFFARDGEAWRFDFRGQLGQVQCPVLVAVGEHDPVTPAEWGREVAAGLPPDKAELVVFEGSSHLVATDEPERLEALIRRFIGAG